MKISQNDILEALAEALKARPDNDETGAVTTTELQEVVVKGIDALRRDLKRLIAEGKIECVRVWRVGIDGRYSPIPGYRPKP